MITTTTSLIEGLKKHSPETVEKFRKYYVPAIYKICLERLNDEAAAEQVTEEVVTSLFRNIKNFKRNNGLFRNYLKKSVYSKIRDFERKQDSIQRSFDRQEFLERLDQFLLRRVIAELKKDTSIRSKSWEMFFLHYRDKIAVEEIATRFQIAPESVKTTLRRIRKKIEREMDE